MIQFLTIKYIPRLCHRKPLHCLTNGGAPAAVPSFSCISRSNIRWNFAVRSAEVQERRHQKISLQQGLVVEFTKVSGEIRIGVIQNRDGKKNWSVLDQNAETCTVKPKQINVVVPGAGNFTPNDLCELLHQADLLQDPLRLEVAWEEMIRNRKIVDLEELAVILYGHMSPEKCYGAYRMLTSFPVYFECKEDGYCPLYEPRSLEEVKQLRLQQLGQEITRRKFLDFVSFVRMVVQLPYEDRPKQYVWNSKSEFKDQLEAMKAFALNACNSEEQKHQAMHVLDALGAIKTAEGAREVMINMGYFGMHENFELLKLNLPIGFSKEALEMMRSLKIKHPFDVDKDRRVDLTSLRVHTIDTENPNEIDDGLSAIRLPDGRFKIWVHVADPTRWVDWDNILRKEASERCTSIYLPTMTIPMFPMELATEFMSLKQGRCCPAISVSVVLAHNGSIAEIKVENSIICPTYQVSYETANELLSLCTQGESELSILYQAATLRRKWRFSNGAAHVSIPKANVHVEGAETSDPRITVTLDDETSPSAILVSEMMILCGEAIAKFGGEHGLVLPYRGQIQNEDVNKQFYTIPEGPARALALLRTTSRVDINFLKPISHSSLGLSGYVQFTSPIRRYADLLAHFQIKSFLRGESSLLLAEYLEATIQTVNATCRTAKRLQLDTERYWILEYLRRQPCDRKYHVCLMRLVRNTQAIILLTEIGIQNSLELQCKRHLGEEFFVQIEVVQPQKSLLVLRDLPKA